MAITDDSFQPYGECVESIDHIFYECNYLQWLLQQCLEAARSLTTNKPNFTKLQTTQTQSHQALLYGSPLDVDSYSILANLAWTEQPPQEQSFQTKGADISPGPDHTYGGGGVQRREIQESLHLWGATAMLLSKWWYFHYNIIVC